MSRLRRRLAPALADARSHRVVLLSHCLLDENARYPGGAGRPGAVREVVEAQLDAGNGLHQLPCPEHRAWGGVDRRWMMLSFGAAGSWRAPVSRLLLRPFLRHTERVYRRLARSVARDVRAHRRAGVDVVGFVGVAGSPSCGVRTTLDLGRAVDCLTRCPLAELDRQRLNLEVVAANLVPGEGMFVRALRRELDRVGEVVDLQEHDLPAELGLLSAAGRASPPAPRAGAPPGARRPRARRPRTSRRPA